MRNHRREKSHRFFSILKTLLLSMAFSLLVVAVYSPRAESQETHKTEIPTVRLTAARAGCAGENPLGYNRQHLAGIIHTRPTFGRYLKDDGEPGLRCNFELRTEIADYPIIVCDEYAELLCKPLRKGQRVKITGETVAHEEHGKDYSFTLLKKIRIFPPKKESQHAEP
jgi:hypothetical protein